MSLTQADADLLLALPKVFAWKVATIEFLRVLLGAAAVFAHEF